MAGTNPPLVRLTWTLDSDPQELILKAGDVVNLGRGEDNTIILDSARVSRNHARIEWMGDRFAVRDLGSINGTYVNDQKVEQHRPCALQDGDDIRLESIVFHYALITLPKLSQDIGKMTTMHGIPRHADTPKTRLEVTGGPEAGNVFVMTGNAMVIGRASQNATWDVRLNDRTISRPHARIERQGSACTLSDLGSANGTIVNDLFVIEPVMLRDGDEIRMGETIIIFHDR